MGPIFSILCTTVFACSADPPVAPVAPVGPSASEQKEIDRLIVDLSHTDFSVRDRAFQALGNFEGKAYRSLLKAESVSPDAETRHRCGLLIPLARQADLNARIAAYLADAKNQYQHDLPGWSRFSQLTSGMPGARELFAEMIRDPGTQKLLLIAEADPTAIHGAVAMRSMELQNRQIRTPAIPPPGLVVPGGGAVRGQVVVTSGSGGPIQPAELLGLFFVDSLTPKSAQIRRPGIGPVTMLYQTSLRTLLVSTTPNGKATPLTDEKATLARAILEFWFDSREESYELNVAMNYAVQYEMPDAAVRAAQRQLKNKVLITTFRGAAIGVLGRYRSEKTLPILESLLTDESPAGTRNEQETDENGKVINKIYSIQSRDIALAMLIRHRGLKPADFGINVFPSESMSYQPTNYWFKTDEERKTAFEKFADVMKKEAEKKPKP